MLAEKIAVDKNVLQPDRVSIDMVDLVVDISEYEFEKYFGDVIKTFSVNPNMTYFEDKRFKRYKHNWNWKCVDENDKEYSVYFAYSLTLNNDTKNRFRLSYNPNKVPKSDHCLGLILNTLLGVFDWKLRLFSCDVAFDYLGIDTEELIMDKGQKREYKIFKYPDSSQTYCIGKSGLDGYVKVYDKASEEGKADEYSKTRYEITVKFGGHSGSLKYLNDYVNVYGGLSKGYRFKGSIPQMILPNAHCSSGLKDNDRLMLYAIEKGYPINRLTRRLKDKYRHLINNADMAKKIAPQSGQIEEAIKQYVHSLYE